MRPGLGPNVYYGFVGLIKRQSKNVVVGHNLVIRIRKAETLDNAHVQFGGMCPKRRHHGTLYEDVKIFLGAPNAHSATREQRGGVKNSGRYPLSVAGGSRLQLARILLVN